MALKAPAFWNKRSWRSRALRPVAWAYQGGTQIHRLISKPQACALPLICVGNLTVGGTGKTPVCLALAQAFLDEGLRVCFLSKGFGGSITAPTWVDPDLHEANQVGDEPLLLAKMAPVLISASRSAALPVLAQSQKTYDLVIMDDGLQNPSLQPDVRLAVIDAGAGFGNRCSFPAGPLREPLEAGLARLDAALVIRTANEAYHPSLNALSPRLLQFHGQTRLDKADSDHKAVLAFCGIGRPQKFFASLEAAGYAVQRTEAFGDHHAYTTDDLSALEEAAIAEDLQLITTRKDWVKLSHDWQAKVKVADLVLELPIGPLKELILQLIGK